MGCSCTKSPGNSDIVISKTGPPNAQITRKNMRDVWENDSEKHRFLIALYYLKRSPEWRRVVGIHGGGFNIYPDPLGTHEDKVECENSNKTYLMKAKLHYVERFLLRLSEVFQRSMAGSENLPDLTQQAKVMEEVFPNIKDALYNLDVSHVQQDFERLHQAATDMSKALVEFAKVAKKKGDISQENASFRLQWDVQGIISGIGFAHPEKSWNDTNKWGGYIFCSHGLMTFPIWHRPYVAEFETLIQKFDPAKKGSGNHESLALPYWHWDPAPEGLPDWATQKKVDLKYLDIDLGSVENPLLRGLHRRPAAADTYAVNPNPTTRDFHRKFNMSSLYYTYMLLAKPWDQVATTDYGGPFNMENPHNMLHDSTGGDMGVISTSSWDPIFFLHHCNVERMFTAWQLRNPAETLPLTPPSPPPSFPPTSPFHLLPPPLIRRPLGEWRLHPFPSPANEHKQRAWWPKPGDGPSAPGTPAEVEAEIGLVKDWFPLSVLWYTYDSYEIGKPWKPSPEAQEPVVLVVTLNRPSGNGRISVRDPTGKEVASHVTLSAGWDGPGGDAEVATCANCVLRSSATLGFDVSSHPDAATLSKKNHDALAAAFQIVWCPRGGDEQPLDTAGMSFSMRKG